MVDGPGPRTVGAAYLVAAAAATVTGAVSSKSVAAVTKPVPLIVLGAEIVRARERLAPVDLALVASAVAFSTVGDRLMLIEEFTEEGPERDRALKRGAGVFAGAQLSYSAALWRRGARPRFRRLLPRMALLGESATVMAIHRPALLPVLGAYGNTLATMSALAADTGEVGLRRGGWAFLASDLSILNRRHLLRDRQSRTVAEGWVLATYFAAQWLLVRGLLRPTSPR
nr:lysoplasmalogenase family protein [Gordonia soli]